MDKPDIASEIIDFIKKNVDADNGFYTKYLKDLAEKLELDADDKEIIENFFIKAKGDGSLFSFLFRLLSYFHLNTEKFKSISNKTKQGSNKIIDHLEKIKTIVNDDPYIDGLFASINGQFAVTIVPPPVNSGETEKKAYESTLRGLGVLGSVALSEKPPSAPLQPSRHLDQYIELAKNRLESDFSSYTTKRQDKKFESRMMIDAVLDTLNSVGKIGQFTDQEIANFMNAFIGDSDMSIEACRISRRNTELRQGLAVNSKNDN